VGLPVIATDGPGIREASPKITAGLRAAGDAASFAQLLQRAIDDPASLLPAIRSAQAFARRHFDLNAMCDAYARLYEQAITS